MSLYKETVKQKKDRLQAHTYEKVIQDLLEKISVLENKLRDLGKEKIKIVTSFKHLEDENSFLKSEYTKSIEDHSLSTQSAQKYKEELENMKTQHSNIVDSYRTKFDLLNKNGIKTKINQ